MKLLNCVISYNRGRYLNNCVTSIQEFLPEGDLLVCDDGSTDAYTLALQDKLETDGKSVVIRNPEPGSKFYHGGLYALMNAGLDYAIEHGYDLLQYLQDDMQILWHDPGLVLRVKTIFDSLDDALQVQNLFYKKLLKYELIEKNRLEWHPKQAAYHLRPYAISDVGFVHVHRLADLGFRFGTSEGSTSDKWQRKGYKMYALCAPTAAFLPWPESYQSKERARQLIRFVPDQPPEKYYLKPLEPHQCKRLLSSRGCPFLEDFSGPWGWRCISPFWFTRMTGMKDAKEYCRFIGQFWKNGEVCFPRLCKPNT